MLDENFRDALQELEDYLDGIEDERLAATVLPFASRWVLPDAGLDLERLRDEAHTFVEATPLSDRVVGGFEHEVAYWLTLRMLVDGNEQEQPERAREQLAAARAALAERAELLDAEGYPRVAAGFRRILEESAGGSPPADLLWNALALRIAESAGA